MNCTTCDTPLTPGAPFCPNCGTRVTTASSSGMPTVALPPAPDLSAAPPQQYTPQPYAPQPYTPPPYVPSPVYTQASLPTSNTAIVSLVFGILGWVVLPFIGAIIAVISGHMARNEIRASNDQLGGRGLATAGLVLGYLQIGLFLLGCVAFLLLGVLGAAVSR